MEAIVSVSMSHPHQCVCTVCRAAGGDVEAIAEVLAEVGWDKARETMNGEG